MGHDSLTGTRRSEEGDARIVLLGLLGSAAGAIAFMLRPYLGALFWSLAALAVMTADRRLRVEHDLPLRRSHDVLLSVSFSALFLSAGWAGYDASPILGMLFWSFAAFPLWLIWSFSLRPGPKHAAVGFFAAGTSFTAMFSLLLITGTALSLAVILPIAVVSELAVGFGAARVHGLFKSLKEPA